MGAPLLTGYLRDDWMTGFDVMISGHSGTVDVLCVWAGTGVTGAKSLLQVWVPEGS